MFEIRPVRDITDSGLDTVREIYNEAFPPEERREWKAMLSLISEEPAFTLYVAEDGCTPVGFITSWDFGDFVYAEHLATTAGVRNKGYGTKIFNSLTEKIGKDLIFEVERPEDSPMAARRIGFYERLGMKVVETSYIQPPYSEGLNPVPMYLMSNRDGYRREWVSRIYSKVYGIKTE